MKATQFAKSHQCDADWIYAMADHDIAVLTPGQQGTYSGTPATIVRHYRNGMYEIRVLGGVIVASGEEFVA